MLERALEPFLAALDRAETVNPNLTDHGTVLVRAVDLRAARDLAGNIEPKPRTTEAPPIMRDVPAPRLPQQSGAPASGPRRTYRFFRSAPGATSQEGDSRVSLLAKCVADQQLNGFGEDIDLRQAGCPDCGSAGFNSGWGYWRFVCGSAVRPTDGAFVVACPLGPPD